MNPEQTPKDVRQRSPEGPPFPPFRCFPPALASALEDWSAARAVPLCYLINVSYPDRMLCFAHAAREPLTVEYEVDGERVPPRYSRSFELYPPGSRPFTVHLHWVPVRRFTALRCLRSKIEMAVRAGSKSVRALRHEHLAALNPRRGRPGEYLIALLARLPWIRRRYGNCWVLVDRDDRADDNAEHLYRWLMLHHPEQRIMFALRRNCSDWKRLQHEGFHLIPINGPSYIFALIHGSWVISSNLTGYVTKMPLRHGLRDKVSSRFCFLQHGVIKDYLPGMNRFHADLFITSARREYESIAEEARYPYVYSARETRLTGLPRHDALLQKKNSARRLVLIMPTWRLSLAEPFIPRTSRRGYNPRFQETLFFRRWRRLLESQALRKAATRQGLKLCFAFHPYLIQQRRDFAFAADILAPEETSLQTLLAHAALLITDYSSVAMDAALLDRPVLYYQFDRKEFQRTHTYTQGYFDYKRDGFGPVAETLPEVEQWAETCLNRGCRNDEVYSARSRAFFAWRDGGNCGRVYEALREYSRARTAPPNARQV